ncbi:MAG: hypothetical protein ACKOPU_05065 [Candidatus Planktophila sp.]
MVAAVVEIHDSENDMVAVDATVNGWGTTVAPPAASSGSFHFTLPKELDGNKYSAKSSASS